jgi:hypothetical protein
MCPFCSAFQGVDLSVVTNVAEGMGSSPGREGVGGEATVDQPAVTWRANKGQLNLQKRPILYTVYIYIYICIYHIVYVYIVYLYI